MRQSTLYKHSLGQAKASLLIPAFYLTSINIEKSIHKYVLSVEMNAFTLKKKTQNKTLIWAVSAHFWVTFFFR